MLIANRSDSKDISSSTIGFVLTTGIQGLATLTLLSISITYNRTILRTCSIFFCPEHTQYIELAFASLVVVHSHKHGILLSSMLCTRCFFSDTKRISKVLISVHFQSLKTNAYRNISKIFKNGCEFCRTRTGSGWSRFVLLELRPRCFHEKIWMGGCERDVGWRFEMFL